MGELKWTGKGLKILGDILEKGDLEDWLVGKGITFLASEVKQLRASWWFGSSRARRKTVHEVSIAVSSATFNAALNQQLEALPTVVASIASWMKANAPDVFHREKHHYLIVAVPCWVVRAVYAGALVAGLGRSKELARFTGLPELLLRRFADRSEDSFFAHVCDSKDIVALTADAGAYGGDPGFAWNGDRGHYYVVSRESYGTDIQKDKERRELQKAAEALREALASGLGVMDAATFEKARESLAAAFHTGR